MESNIQYDNNGRNNRFYHYFPIFLARTPAFPVTRGILLLYILSNQEIFEIKKFLKRTSSVHFEQKREEEVEEEEKEEVEEEKAKG